MLETLALERRAGDGPLRWRDAVDRVDRPRSARRGAATRPRAARRRTVTSWPMWTSSGSHPTMFVVRCTLGVLGERDVGDDVGRLEVGKPLVGVHREADDRAPARDRRRLARPAPAVRADRAPEDGRVRRSRCSPGCGGQPSAPEVQNHSFAGVSSGSGLMPGPRATARATARAATNPQPSAMGEPGPVLTSTSLSNTADMLGARPGRARVWRTARACPGPGGQPGRARDLADTPPTSFWEL